MLNMAEIEEFLLKIENFLKSIQIQVNISKIHLIYFVNKFFIIVKIKIVINLN